MEELTIRAGESEKRYFGEIWKYKELFLFLAWRDLLLRYKQTVIGILWAVLRPLLTMAVFTLVFGVMAKLPSNGIPYPIMVFTAMLPWQLFDSALSESSASMISNANMITKVYFPRIIIPFCSIMTSLVDFIISFCILVIMMFAYGYLPDWKMLLLPFPVILAVAASAGPGLWFASLNVKYRDFKYIVPFIVRLGLYISPVGFSSDIIPEGWRLLYSLNPMVGVIDIFRWVILGGSNTVHLPGLIISTAMMTVILVSGIVRFRNTERYFADFI